MSEFSGEQVHPATPSRLQQARQDGQLVKSFELAGAIQLVGGLFALFLLAGSVGSSIVNWTRSSWQTAIGSQSDQIMDVELGQQWLMSFLGVVAPLLVLLFLLSIVAHWIQTGPFFSARMVAPRPERVSPLNWWRKLFSLQTAGTPFVVLPKATVSFAVAGWVCWVNRMQVFELSGAPVELMAQQLFGLVLKVSLTVAVVLLIFSLIDYVFHRLSFLRRMRMTDQQMRDEMRMQNGDPQVQAWRRQHHQSFTRRI